MNATTATAPRYVEVAVATRAPLPPRAGVWQQGVYTYHLENGQEVEVGQLVEVPFGSRNLLGVVIGIAPVPPPFETRSVRRVLAGPPLLTPTGVELARFIARTYRAPLFECLCLILPPGFSARVEQTLRAGAWSPPRSRRGVADTGPATADASVPRGGPALTTEQRRVCDEILDAFRRGQHRAFLLQGVTGSGKTLVYLEAAAEVVASGRQVILLQSEIGLTPELLARVQERFPGRCVVLHSRLSPAEHYANWHAVAEGRAQVVVGSRSAIFAPARRLGLIVLDEEHEWTYKQESVPRYHARDVALELGRLLGVPVVLSSATPDVVTSWRARQGELRSLTLSVRYSPAAPSIPPGGSSLPPVEVVDLRRELRAGNRGIFSRALQEALGVTLARGEQAILFINRRGMATCVTCRLCGFVASCRRCDVPMVYHRAGEALVCHRCNRRRPRVDRCPACGESAIRHLGVGTQRVEHELATHFPQARVVRADRDAAKARSEALVWDLFRRGEADILVGTQLVAKALDFPNVTLVGVVLADVGLFLPDFRAAERCFQLLTQVAGRAGRGAREGRVIVQTYSPEHYAVRHAAAHDYEGFYQREIAFRQFHGYPPFGRLVRFVVSASDERRCWREAGRVRQLLHQRIAALEDPELRIIGPAPCYVARVRGRYRWQLIVRGQSLDQLLDGLVLPPGWTMDVDPVSLL